MEQDLTDHLELLSVILDQIDSCVQEYKKIPNVRVHKDFLVLKMKFEKISESINVKYTNLEFEMAVDLVEKRGYVSYNEISRKLGIIYQHSFHIALEMERRGIVAAPVPGVTGKRYFITRKPLDDK